MTTFVEYENGFGQTLESAIFAEWTTDGTQWVVVADPREYNGHGFLVIPRDDVRIVK